ncbi:MAG: hypothetical protein U0350_37795 [Caldilineaceae bacterium]
MFDVLVLLFDFACDKLGLCCAVVAVIIGKDVARFNRAFGVDFVGYLADAREDEES